MKNMPTITVQKNELAYDEKDVITFEEGLIGLPHLRRMVLASPTDIEPFLWLASLDEPGAAFLVAEPRAFFPDYDPRLPGQNAPRPAPQVGRTAVLAIVVVAADWRKSTINLRAPLFVSVGTMRGTQVVLTDSVYKLDEALPTGCAVEAGG